MKPRRYSAADMEVAPWPKPEPTRDGESTTWTLTLDRQAEGADADLVRERVGMSDPAQQVVAIVVGDRQLVVRFHWDRYDGDALARSVKLVRLVVQMLPVVLVQEVPVSKWSVLMRDD